MNTETRYARPISPGQSRARARLAATAAAGPVLAAGKAVACVLASCAIIMTAAACTAARTPGPGPARVPPVLRARPAPAEWLRATLPGGGAVLAYPPSMHMVKGDSGTVTAARFSASGQYLLYLNVTPRQGAESLRDWAAFRLGHQRADNASAVRELAAETGVGFLGGTGTCLTDAYVTKIGAHHFTEIACFVRGRTSATVIVAAAPTADWASAARLLWRALGAYLVR